MNATKVTNSQALLVRVKRALRVVIERVGCGFEVSVMKGRCWPIVLSGLKVWNLSLLKSCLNIHPNEGREYEGGHKGFKSQIENTLM